MTLWDILWITASQLIIYSLRGWKTNYDIPSGFDFEWCSYHPSTIFQFFKAILVKTKMKEKSGYWKGFSKHFNKDQPGSRGFTWYTARTGVSQEKDLDRAAH